jgi:hypothetical protein
VKEASWRIVDSVGNAVEPARRGLLSGEVLKNHENRGETIFAKGTKEAETGNAP